MFHSRWHLDSGTRSFLMSTRCSTNEFSVSAPATSGCGLRAYRRRLCRALPHLFRTFCFIVRRDFGVFRRLLPLTFNGKQRLCSSGRTLQPRLRLKRGLHVHSFLASSARPTLCPNSQLQLPSRSETFDCTRCLEISFKSDKLRRDDAQPSHEGRVEGAQALTTRPLAAQSFLSKADTGKVQVF